ncbi:MAG: DUF6309 family protein [Candidatus Woesearchaeota archaeon]
MSEAEEQFTGAVILLSDYIQSGDNFINPFSTISGMRIFDIQRVDFETVMQQYREDNGPKNDWWEERNLSRANEKFGGWIRAKIPVSDIGSVVMPYYNHGGACITPEEGAPLSVAYASFKNDRQKFEQGNAQFCDRFDSQKESISRNGIKPVYLSQEPLLIGTSYSNLKKYKNRLTHLDGFHRLMALMDSEQTPDYVECFIAVYPAFEPARFSGRSHECM